MYLIRVSVLIFETCKVLLLILRLVDRKVIILFLSMSETWHKFLFCFLHWELNSGSHACNQVLCH